MSEKYITGVIKLPNEEAEVATDIENSLEGLRALVDGSIQTVAFEDCIAVCNDEGLQFGLSPNCKFRGIDFFGPIVVVDHNGEDFTSLRIVNPDQIAAELDEGSYE